MRELAQASLLLHQLVEADELEEQQQQLAGLFGSKGGAVQPAGGRREPAGTRREQPLPGMSSPFRKGGAVAQRQHPSGRAPAAGSSAAPLSVAPASLQPALTQAPALAPAMPTPTSGSALLLPAADQGASFCSSDFNLQSPCESTGSCAALHPLGSVGEDLSEQLAGTPEPGGGRAEAVVMDELHVHTARSVTKQRSRRGMTGVCVWWRVSQNPAYI